MDRTLASDSVARTSEASWRSALAAPFLYFLSPSRASRHAAEGPRAGSIVFLFIGGLLFGATMVSLHMWGSTVVRTWEMPTGPGQMQSSVSTYSMAEVWTQWHPEGGFSGAALVVLLYGILLAGVLAIETWLLLPTVHGGGPVSRSIRQAFSATTCCVGVVFFLTTLIGSAIVTVLNYLDANDSARLQGYEFGLVILVLGGLCFQVAWVSRAARTVALPQEAVEFPPRCEKCGYDLTAQPEDARCPECGETVAASLSPERRPGVGWQRSMNFATGVRTVIQIVLNQDTFYRSLKMRVPREFGERFARPQAAVIAVLSAGWLAAMLLRARYVGFPEFPAIPIISGLLITLCCWGTHRLIGTAVMSWWIVQGVLPSSDWGRAIICYESAYLWVLAFYNGFLISSFMLYGEWITDCTTSIGLPRYTIFSMEWEVAVLLGGSILLIVNWLNRYRRAAAAVRWSNY